MPRTVTAAPPSSVTVPSLMATVLSVVDKLTEPVITVGAVGITTLPYDKPTELIA